MVRHDRVSTERMSTLFRIVQTADVPLTQDVASRIWREYFPDIIIQKQHERFGFFKIEAAVNDIGGGFMMDDYLRELKI